jgi:triacylglycerol lipase
MSFFVELDRQKYPDDALNGFTATRQFNLDNAQAMMWLAQLAYETADKSKVKSILDAWQLTMHEFISNNPNTGLPPDSACVVVAGGRGATFVTFAGSDPGKIQDWITDFDAMPSAQDLHTGFQNTIGNVWTSIKTAIENRPASEQPIFFTGHSLGGALAIVAASRAALELNIQGIAVYTFGSPRTGGTKFFGDYTPLLGDSTFRLIDGTDIVPTVPPPLSGGYRHVGHAIQCKTDGIFDAQTPIMAPNQNKPELVESAIQSALADSGAIANFQIFHHGLGTGLLNHLSEFLPRMIRDHVPANYFRALSINVPPPKP